MGTPIKNATRRRHKCWVSFSTFQNFGWNSQTIIDVFKDSLQTIEDFVPNHKSGGPKKGRVTNINRRKPRLFDYFSLLQAYRRSKSVDSRILVLLRIFLHACHLGTLPFQSPAHCSFSEKLLLSRTNILPSALCQISSLSIVRPLVSNILVVQFCFKLKILLCPRIFSEHNLYIVQLLVLVYFHQKLHGNWEKVSKTGLHWIVFTIDTIWFRYNL